MKKKDTQEIEFKWSILSPHEFQTFLNAARLLGKLSRPKEINIKDNYLDTPDRLFGKLHISCRLRNYEEKWELTLKSQSSLKNGLAARREQTFMLKGIHNFSDALRSSRKEHLDQITGGKKLILLFKIHNKRTKHYITLLDKTYLEISFDRVTLIKGTKKISMLEIELEFLRGHLETFQSFVTKITRDTKLQPAQISKVKTALKMFSLEIKKPATTLNPK